MMYKKNIYFKTIIFIIAAAVIFCISKSAFQIIAKADSSTEAAYVTDLQEDSSALKKDIVIIGDSYAAGYADIDTSSTWAGLPAMREIQGPGSVISVKSGTGFLNVSDGIVWKDLLEDAYLKSSDPEGIDLVIIGGGVNDCYCSQEEIYRAAVDLINDAKTKFPNAEILLAHFGWNTDSEINQLVLAHTIPAWIRAARTTGSDYLPYCDAFFSSNPYYVLADGLHPTRDGQKHLAKIVRQYLDGYHWNLDGSKLYYQSETGTVATGWNYIRGQWYAMDSSGKVLTGMQEIDGSRYCFSSYGAMFTGWIYDSGEWYYADSTGVLQTGWQTIDGERKFFDSTGAMLTEEWSSEYRLSIIKNRFANEFMSEL